MSQMYRAIEEIEKFENLAKRDQWMNHVHPLVKLLLSIFYIGITVSFDKYQINGLLVMAVYPLFVFIVGELSLKDAFYRLRFVLPIVLVVGMCNPLIDRKVMFTLGNVAITSGMISMLSLVIKGLLTVLSAYLLIATTTMEDICESLRRLHLPKILVTTVLLIYRYLSLFLVEISRITTAYRLRAPGQKGIHYKAWGSLVGQMLLRSMDRANAVYESMCLRGFRGEFFSSRRQKIKWGDIAYLLFWATAFVLIRYISVIETIGNMIAI